MEPLDWTLSVSPGPWIAVGFLSSTVSYVFLFHLLPKLESNWISTQWIQRSRMIWRKGKWMKNSQEHWVVPVRTLLDKKRRRTSDKEDEDRLQKKTRTLLKVSWITMIGSEINWFALQLIYRCHRPSTSEGERWMVAVEAKSNSSRRSFCGIDKETGRVEERWKRGEIELTLRLIPLMGVIFCPTSVDYKI